MDVPYVDLAAARGSLGGELDRAVLEVLAAGSYIMGPQVHAFEAEFSRWTGAAHTVAVGSGTDAIYLALRAAGVGPGDEVLTVAHTAVNTALAVSRTGAMPVFVDINSETYCIDPALLAGALSARTRAILPVHLYGHPVDMDPLLAFAAEHGLLVVEDCAQAHGARYRGAMVGTLGHAGCFSFYPTKNLGACGDGGSVCTSDPALAARVRSLANSGQGDRRYEAVVQGDVSRMDEIQGAILRVKLRVLEAWNEQRREAAAFYERELAELPVGLPAEREWACHVFHLYVIRSKERDRLQRHLAAHGVQALVHYPVPVHRQRAYLGADTPALPVSEQAAAEVLSLPVYPQISDGQLMQVRDAVAGFFGES